jgi:ABC-type multidrug transport system fused ATPase/permease subunit
MPKLNAAKPDGPPAPAMSWWQTVRQLKHFRFALLPSLASSAGVMVLALIQADLAVAATSVGQAIFNSFGAVAGKHILASGSWVTDPLVSVLTGAGGVPRLAGAMALLLFLAEGLSIFSEQCRSLISLRFRERLQERLLAGLTRATGQERNQWEPGLMHMAVCQDASGIGAVLVFGLLGSVEKLIRIAGYAWGLMLLPGGGGVTAVILPAAIIANWLVFRGFIRSEESATKRNNEAMIRQHTRSLGVFHVLSRLTQLRGEKAFVEQVLRDSRQAGEANRTFQLITSLRGSLTGMLAQASLPLVALLLSSPATLSALDPGKLAQVQVLAMMILANVSALLSLPGMFVQYGPVIDRLLGIMQIPEPEREPPALPRLIQSGKLGIVVDHLRFAYPGSDRILFDDLHLEIPAGALVGIVGESGSGKSTLTRVLSGDFPVASGAIRVGEVDISDWHPWWRRHLIGAVPSDAGFIKDTLRRNLEWGRPAPAPDRLKRVIHECQIERAWGQFADTELESADEHLSSGERRRVGVARLLLGDQPVWIFDEPLANLDPRTMREVAAAIESAARGRTTLVISHDPDMLATDFNVFLAEGRILDQGTHAELMERNPRYRDLVGRHQATRNT